MCQEINFLNFKAATLDICEELKVKNCFLTFNIYFLTHNKCKKCIFFFFFFFLCSGCNCKILCKDFKRIFNRLNAIIGRYATVRTKMEV